MLRLCERPMFSSVEPGERSFGLACVPGTLDPFAGVWIDPNRLAAPCTLIRMGEELGQAGEITVLLSDVRSGVNAREAEARVVDLAYGEMRRIAGAIADPNRGGTINATALVHEAWLKLSGNLTDVNDRCHFLALAARAMRQVMADAARAKSRQKRGGDRVRYTLHDADGAQGPGELDLAELHEVLESLRREHPRQAEVFELRAFGSLTFGEVGRMLEISESSARMDWQFSRAWLRSALGDMPRRDGE